MLIFCLKNEVYRRADSSLRSSQFFTCVVVMDGTYYQVYFLSIDSSSFGCFNFQPDETYRAEPQKNKDTETILGIDRVR